MTKEELYQRMLGLLNEAEASKREKEQLEQQETEEEEEEEEQAVLSSSLPPEQQTGTAPSLNTRQLNAIDLIITGKTDREVADQVGVTRQTVSYWRHHNPPFIAELNFRRQALWGANAEKLRHLASKAITVLDAGMESTHYLKIPYRHHAAVHILRSIGLYGKHLIPQGEISPEAVEQALRISCPTSLSAP